MKVAICVPQLRQVEAMFAVALSGLTYFTAKSRPELELQVFEFSSSVLPVSRMTLAYKALAWGAAHVLWLDSDMIFPPNSLGLLLARDVDVVGANYVRKQAEPTPVAVALDGSPVRQGRGLQEVKAIGFGVCLTSRRVLDALEPPLFAFEQDGPKITGEDYYFCARARAAGFRVYVDHDIFAGHIHQCTLTMADAAGRQNGDHSAHAAPGAE